MHVEPREKGTPPFYKTRFAGLQCRRGGGGGPVILFRRRPRYITYIYHVCLWRSRRVSTPMTHTFTEVKTLACMMHLAACRLKSAVSSGQHSIRGRQLSGFCRVSYCAVRLEQHSLRAVDRLGRHAVVARILGPSVRDPDCGVKCIYFSFRSKCRKGI